MSEQRKIRVAVVFGGRGPEHAVSCMGGGNMLESIDRAKYDVVPIGITRDGGWVQVADEPARLTVIALEPLSVKATMNLAPTSRAVLQAPRAIASVTLVARDTYGTCSKNALDSASSAMRDIIPHASVG